jgi:hypothetical protein
MKLCHAHEDKLRAAISSRGLDRFIKSQVDPLLAARYALTINALMTCGPSLLVPNDKGNLPCPLCHLAKHATCSKPECKHEGHIGKSVDVDWIQFAADEQSKRYADGAA